MTSVQKLGLVLTRPRSCRTHFLAVGRTLGYIVHGDRGDLANSNVADVFNSIINMLGTAVTIVVILLSAPLAKIFGKKAVAVVGFGLSTVNALVFYMLPARTRRG